MAIQARPPSNADKLLILDRAPGLNQGDLLIAYHRPRPGGRQCGCIRAGLALVDAQPLANFSAVRTSERLRHIETRCS
jgi:hypothetical protein